MNATFSDQSCEDPQALGLHRSSNPPGPKLLLQCNVCPELHCSIAFVLVSLKEGVMFRRWLLALCVVVMAGLAGCIRLDPVCGSTLYQESFGGVGAGWTQATYSNSRTWIEGGRYRVEVLGDWTYVYRWNEEEGPYSDLCYSATAWDLSREKSNGFGLVVRCTDASNLYLFQIHAESRQVSMAKRVSGQASLVVPWQQHDAVRGVGEPNHLQVRVEGSRFEFYVNGELVIEATDVSLASGFIGVAGSSSDDGATDHAFDDIVVREYD